MTLRISNDDSGPRTLRSSREIRLMRKPGFLVWQAHQIAAKLIKPGVTTGEIDAAVERHFALHDAIPLFKNFPGPIPFPAVTCMSINEEVVHGIPGSRELKDGDIVSIDTGCKLNGWCGDAAITHPVGEVSPRKKKLLEVTQGTLDLAIELMAVKSTWAEVAREMGDFVRDSGFSVVEDFVGHAIGRDMHEKPQVLNYYDPKRFSEGGDFDLRPGVVIAVEPMVNAGVKEVRCLDDQWTQVTADGKPSAHFEHTIALSKDGPLLLTGPPSDDE
jgi:methionyl aminopeptidase